MPHEVGRGPALPVGQALGLPDPFPGVRPQSAHLSVTADAVDRVAQDQRRRDVRVQSVRLGDLDAVFQDAVGAAVLPENRRGRSLARELHHQRAGVEPGYQQVRPAVYGVGDRRLSAREQLFPVQRAGFRVERGEAGRVPDDQLPYAARLDDVRLAVAQLAARLERPPALLAGVLVEGHDERVRLGPDDVDDAVAVDDGRDRGTPDRDEHVVLGHGVLLPDHVAGRDVQAEDASRRAEQVDAVAVDGRRGTRAARVAGHQDPVGRGPLVRPQHLAAVFVEGLDAFVPLHRAPLGLHVVEDEHAAAGHGGAGEAAAHRYPPLDDESFVGKLAEDSGLGPDAEPVGAAPLRPVFGRERPSPGQAGQQDAGTQKTGGGQGRAKTNRLLPELGRSSGVRPDSRAADRFPVLAATYWRPSTA